MGLGWLALDVLEKLGTWADKSQVAWIPVILFYSGDSVELILTNIQNICMIDCQANDGDVVLILKVLVMILVKIDNNYQSSLLV